MGGSRAGLETPALFRRSHRRYLGAPARDIQRLQRLRWAVTRDATTTTMQTMPTMTMTMRTGGARTARAQRGPTPSRWSSAPSGPPGTARPRRRPGTRSAHRLGPPCWSESPAHPPRSCPACALARASAGPLVASRRWRRSRRWRSPPLPWAALRGEGASRHRRSETRARGEGVAALGAAGSLRW